ncbi:hypothetical protein MPSEU_000436800 [Mayamaea pseudoterrestris]|nr:hypothetical protein MPSEU_000436800 [Mayamaea pseudoterrestris]
MNSTCYSHGHSSVAPFDDNANTRLSESSQSKIRMEKNMGTSKRPGRVSWKQSVFSSLRSAPSWDATTCCESLTDSSRSVSNASDVFVSSPCLKIATQDESLSHRYRAAPDDAAQTLKNVSFGCVDVHSHGRLLGDNPAVSTGAPLTITWTSFDTFTTSIDEFEETKQPSRYPSDQPIPRHVRERWLLAAGHKRSEISVAERQAQRTQSKRWDSFEKSMDGPKPSLQVRFANVFALRKRKTEALALGTVADDDEGWF